MLERQAEAVTASSIADVSLLTHPGCVRKDNQDRVGHAACPKLQLAVVADGVGGEAGGARAAELAVKAYVQSLAPCMDTLQDGLPADALQRATQMIQQQIVHMRETDAALSAMASTVAVVHLQSSLATVGHLGDARVYLFHTGQLRRLTQDHSVVQQMVSRGLLTEEEGLTHPQGHILTQSLGQPGALLEITTQPVAEGDLLLLCSDGLWSCVPDEVLSRELNEATANLAHTAQRLLDLALDTGAPDNVSLALLRVLPQASEDASAVASVRPRPVFASQRAIYALGAFLLLALLCMLAWFFHERTAFP